MAAKTRKFIFYSLVVLFVLLGLGLILYSSGWLFNLKTLRLYQSGGINIAALPEKTEVKIDQINYKKIAEAPLSNFFISGLAPDVYKLTVEKEGFNTWTKNLIIRPALVAQIPPILLLPQKQKPELLLTNVKNFYIGPKYIAYETKTGKLIINNKNSIGNNFIGWLADEETALTYSSQNKNYFLIKTGSNTPALNLNLIFKNLKEKGSVLDNDSAPRMLPHPFNSNKILIISTSKIYALDFLKFSLETISKKSSNLILVKNSKLFFIDDLGLSSLDLITKNEQLITDELTAKPEIIEASPSGDFLALIGDKKLTLINLSDSSVKKISDSAKNFRFAPDNGKIAYLENENQLKIFFLKNQFGWLNKQQNEISSLSSHELDDNDPIEWHNNSAYLILKYPKKITLLDIDDRPPVNEQTISEDFDDYKYDNLNNLIYLIKSGNLFKLQ